MLATWTGVLLLHHPRHLATVLSEQAALLGTKGMTLAALKQLMRLERCIEEAERLHPPLVMLMRKAIEEFEFDSHVVPPGDLVMVSPAVSHRIAEISPTLPATIPIGSRRRAKKTAGRRTG